MIQKKTVLEGCSVVFFLKILLRKLGKTNVSENAFWLFFEQQTNWVNVLLREDSTLELPKIALMDSQAFWQLVDENEWLLELIEYVSANGQQFSFHEAELISFPPWYFEHDHLCPEFALAQAVQLFLWFCSAVKELGLKIKLDAKSFSTSHVHITSPFAKRPISSVALTIEQLWDSYQDWELVLKTLRIRYPDVNVRALWTWVTEYRSAFTNLPGLAYDEMLKMSFNTSNIDEIVPAHLKRGSDIRLSPTTHECLQAAVQASKLSERKFILSLFDENDLLATFLRVQKQIPKLFFPVYLQLVKYYSITSQ